MRNKPDFPAPPKYPILIKNFEMPLSIRPGWRDHYHPLRTKVLRSDIGRGFVFKTIRRNISIILSTGIWKVPLTEFEE